MYWEPVQSLFKSSQQVNSGIGPSTTHDSEQY